MSTSSTSKGRSDYSANNMTKASTVLENTIGDDKRKNKNVMPKMFNSKRLDERILEEDVFRQKELALERKFTSRKQAFLEASPVSRKSFSDRHSSVRIEGLNLSTFEKPKTQSFQLQDYRVFVGTWNVGGKTPNNSLNLEDFLQVEDSFDIYILGFQEIVPLNAGNVLVIEDNEPAAKWLALISQALNRPLEQGSNHEPSDPFNSRQQYAKDSKSASGLLFFQKPSLKVLTRNYQAEGALLKMCNCPSEPSPGKRKAKEMRDLIHRIDTDFGYDAPDLSSAHSSLSYSLISSKQMVGIFLSVWVRSELVQHVGHLRTSSLGRGIMNCLGNKGCIAISMSLHQTSFCFVCSHLTSGEKEGDELKRNSDVLEILKNTQFPKICKSRTRRVPEKIIEHDRVIWLGDLNYRISLSYNEARTLLEDNNWDALLEKDQLRNEKEAGRVFQGWNEGRIFFAPTYKYTQNSDCYAGETTKSKKKRRTPAWCDRILWYGNGIEQLSYTRGESRFSDHRPVCAVFSIQVELLNSRNRCRKGYSSVGARMGYEECVPQRHSFYEY